MKMKLETIMVTALALLIGLSVTSSWAHKELFDKMGIVYPKRVKTAPVFDLTDLNGTRVNLEKYRGKAVLLNFWATWCQACKEEMPAMERLHKELSKEGVQIVAISIDRGNEDRIKEFVEKYNLTFPILLDPNQTVRRNYFIMGLPTSYLIDPQGKLRGFVSGARPWDSVSSKQVMRLLKNFQPDQDS